MAWGHRANQPGPRDAAGRRCLAIAFNNVRSTSFVKPYRSSTMLVRYAGRGTSSIVCTTVFVQCPSQAPLVSNPGSVRFDADYFSHLVRMTCHRVVDKSPHARMRGTTAILAGTKLEANQRLPFCASDLLFVLTTMAAYVHPLDDGNAVLLGDIGCATGPNHSTWTICAYSSRGAAKAASGMAFARACSAKTSTLPTSMPLAVVSNITMSCSYLLLRC